MNNTVKDILDPRFHQMQINVFEKEQAKSCITFQNIQQECNESMPFGKERQFGESCAPRITTDMSDNCSSVWNNMTKQKSIVDGY